jgi:uncharacterized protein YndB with AHSA1/START domain
MTDGHDVTDAVVTDEDDVTDAVVTDEDDVPDAVVIERTFDAPVGLVWRMWTEEAHFRAWYGPDGATIPVAELDVRVGGTRRVCMEVRSPDGPVQMWFVGEHREVVENERLVFTESLTHGDGGEPEGQPAATVVAVELADLGGRTRMVLTHHGVPAGSPGAVGWSMALDKLATRLATHDIH